jgi:6-phosphogluconolactonase
MAEIEIFPGRLELAQAAAEQFIGLAARAVASRGRFTVALAGGSTPRPVYSLLTTEAFAGRLDWSRVHIFWGDERCVSPDDPQSNYRMARETLLDAVGVPPGNIHRIRGEDDPRRAAAAYEQELREFFGHSAGFDLVLLGMGADGHTASLFPGLAAVTEGSRWVMAQYVEAVSMWRITLTPAAINAAENVTFIVSGADKAERLREVLEGPSRPEALPAQAIKPISGRLLWLVDEAAAASLTRRREENQRGW